MSSRFNDLLRKAQGAISNLRTGGSSFFLGRNGEVIYSKNNVCVHESTFSGSTNSEEPTHTPGYLSIHCLDDEQLGVTLVLQWLPNTLLQKNPTSIRCVSPRPIDMIDQIGLSSNSGPLVKKISCSNRPPRTNSEEEEEEEESSTMTGGGTEPTSADEQQPLLIDSKASTAICMELNGESGCFSPTTELGSSSQRPNTLMATMNCGQGLSIPEINLIPNTPIDQLDMLEENVREKSESSGATSGEDEEDEEDGDERPLSSADDEGEADLDATDEENLAKAKSQSLEALRQHYAASLNFGSIPEQFALEHNLVLKGEEGKVDEGDGKESSRLAMAKERVQFAKSSEMSSIASESTKSKSNSGRAGLCTLFSVNLGKMRSMRVFYSDPERTSGQLVIASPDSQYKIFHFHHAGLDKLAALFERWNAVKSKTAGNDSPSVMGPDRHLMICPDDGDLARTELDPEDGLYEQLSWELWRSYISQDGSVEDSFTIRKVTEICEPDTCGQNGLGPMVTIFFASMDPSLRKEVWPFLLRIFPWASSYEQRDAIRNDLFLRYQRLKRNRIRRVAKGTAIGDSFYSSVESSIYKDVVRTDRRNSYFAGEENANLEIMKSILMTYAIRYPEINYIQGMSDLLAPLLYTLRDETIAYWCFSALMKLTLFCQSIDGHRSVMEIQLDYLKELLRLFTPEFFAHLEQIGGDAPNLMFVHRWILLFFKREFPPKDALHIWEACWARYRSAHFHLFIACAIVSVFGPDVVAQKLPHDEILLYFSSLAMHMDARLILRKARGLLYQFHRLPKIPCTLAGLLEEEIHSDQWNSHISIQREFECIQQHEGGICPFANISEI